MGSEVLGQQAQLLAAVLQQVVHSRCTCSTCAAGSPHESWHTCLSLARSAVAPCCGSGSQVSSSRHRCQQRRSSQQPAAAALTVATAGIRRLDHHHIRAAGKHGAQHSRAQAAVQHAAGQRSRHAQGSTQGAAARGCYSKHIFWCATCCCCKDCQRLADMVVAATTSWLPTQQGLLCACAATTHARTAAQCLMAVAVELCHCDNVL